MSINRSIEPHSRFDKRVYQWIAQLKTLDRRAEVKDAQASIKRLVKCRYCLLFKPGIGHRASDEPLGMSPDRTSDETVPL